jgi:histidinol dehydrogenase
MKVINADNNFELNEVLQNSQFNNQETNQQVKDIVETVLKQGDQAVRDYTKQFDKVVLDTFKVTDVEIEAAYQNIDPLLIDDLKKAYENILRFHEKQMLEDYYIESNGSKIGQIIRPIETVGIYVPGGTAAYPSTVLMNTAPAKIAGVKNIIMITPPNIEGKIKDILLVAAKIAGVDQIFKVGGAQGIAALTYGTTQIPKVDKIVGPGNIYVALAKKLVSGFVGIDMVAGPSEVVIIADEEANPSYIAADLLAQAEHDVLAKVILLTPSTTIVDRVQEELKRQTETLSRRSIINDCLENNGYIINTSSIEEAILISNKIAPEHLELQFKDAEKYINQINNAGAIFVGEFTPEPVGDYYAGPNHTLPTSGTARFNSALSTTDFIKKISLIQYSKESLDKSKDSIIRIANEEGLTAHANAIKVRYKNV